MISERCFDFLDIHGYVGPRISLGLLDYSTHQKALNKYLYIPSSSFHPPELKAGWIKAELVRHVRNCSTELEFLRICTAFALRLLSRGYRRAEVRRLITQVDYSDRCKYLLQHQPPSAPGFPPPVLVVPYSSSVVNLDIRGALVRPAEIPSGIWDSILGGPNLNGPARVTLALKRNPNLGTSCSVLSSADSPSSFIYLHAHLKFMGHFPYLDRNFPGIFHPISMEVCHEVLKRLRAPVY